MRKMNRFLIAAAALVLVACGKEAFHPVVPPPQPEPVVPEEHLVFEFNCTYSEDTKAQKSGWEAGDVVWVFIKQVPSPYHIKLAYDGSKWAYTLMNGDASVTSLGVALNGTNIDMRAIYRPFGNSDYIENSDGKYMFHTTQDSYYLTDAKSSYEVKDNKISVNFTMKQGEDQSFVQFYIEDAGATDGGYYMYNDAVKSVELQGLNSDLSINRTIHDFNYGLTGYAYEGGYLFSGILDDSYSATYGTNYYFAKVQNVTGRPRADYVVTGKALKKKSAIKLPAQGSSKWQAVGNDVTVNMGSAGTWYTCDYLQTRPEDHGVTYSFTDVGTHSDAEHAIPSVSQLTYLMALTHFPMKVRGHAGNVFVSPTGFLFIPATYYYWGPASSDSDAWYLYSGSDGTITLNAYGKDARHIRFVTAN